MSLIKREKPGAADIEFMRSFEAEFKEASGLKDRSQYKIFYSPTWPAKIMVLGINPGGDPDSIASDGVRSLDGGASNAASDGYYENGENDLIDCDWRENTGLLKILTPLLGSREDVRKNVVKTNLAFARSKNAKERKFINDAKKVSSPFLLRLLNRVRPELILLAGVKMDDFVGRYCDEFAELAPRIEERSVNQTAIWPAQVRLRDGRSCIAIEVAHASQFSWIYERYSIASKITSIMSSWRPVSSIAQ